MLMVHGVETIRGGVGVAGFDHDAVHAHRAALDPVKPMFPHNKIGNAAMRLRPNIGLAETLGFPHTILPSKRSISFT